MTTVPVPLTSEEEAALIAQAKAQGVSVDSLLRKAVLQIISAGPETKPQLPPQLSAEEFEQAFEEIADMIPEGIPPLSDEALSRESIYSREDEWNRTRRPDGHPCGHEHSAAMATSGHVSISDHLACIAAADELFRARRESGEAAVGRSGQPVINASALMKNDRPVLAKSVRLPLI